MIQQASALRGTAAILEYARQKGYLKPREQQVVAVAATALSPMVHEHARTLHLTFVSHDRFKTQSGAEFSLTSFIKSMHENDFSGVLDSDVDGVQAANEPLLHTNEDLTALMALAKLVCSQAEYHLLDQAKQNLEKLKAGLYEELGFAKDGGKLLDMLSRASTVINHPLAFGAASRDDTGGRAMHLLDIQNYINEKWPLNRGRNSSDPCWFPTNVQDKTAALFTQAGLPLQFKAKDQKFAGIEVERGSKKVVMRHPISLPVRGYVAKCLRPVTDIDGVCINDEAPNYFKSLFPPGLHLIVCE